jgi:hypothetical protein
MAQRGTIAHIDLKELEKLAMLQCTDEEIAAWFGVSVKTIERRRKVQRFAEAMDRGRAKGRISVRRMQMKLLEAGNATMGVWLGKNILGQVDTVSVTSDGPLMYIAMPMPPRPSSGAPPADLAVTIDVGSSGDESLRVQRMLEAGKPAESTSLVTGHLRLPTR